MRYVFKITISGISQPQVWRRVAIPADYSFFKFHKVIQIIFGWENIHSFEFFDATETDPLHIFMPHEKIEDYDMRAADASKTHLRDIFSEDKKQYSYRYDSNDNWIHDIVLEDISDEVLKCPRCHGGEGMCPPEGCGGPKEYQHIKYLLNEKPDSDEARRCREWLFMEDDDVFDPSYFPEAETEEINEILGRFAK